MSTRSTAAVRVSRPVSRPVSTRTVAPHGSTPRAAASRPDLRLVTGGAAARTRRRVSALGSRRAPFVLLVVALLVGTTLGLLVLNTAIAVDSLKATELRAENAQRAQEVQRLEQQVVAGGTPAEIARAAVAQGLVPAGTAGYLVIGPDGEAVLRGTPAPAADPAEVRASGD